jgi:hypothetical protein
MRQKLGPVLRDSLAGEFTADEIEKSVQNVTHRPMQGYVD